MFPVFGQDRNDMHPCVAELKRWSHPASDQQKRAVARNLMHDDRVSEEREKAFLSYVTQNPNNLDTALKKYFDEQIRTQHSLETVYHQHNAVNLVSGPFSSSSPGFDKSVMLARVLDLNGLKHPVNWVILQLIDDQNDLPSELKKKCRRIWGSRGIEFTEGEFSDWLNAKLTNASEATKQELMTVLLGVLNHHRRKFPYQPVWATLWNLFEEHAQKEQPHRWAQTLGMSKKAGRWLAVLTYRLGETLVLARPTFLEADGYEYHFPSPVSEMPGNGGHPMDLQTVPPANKLLPEFIHQQIDHKIEHWLNAGSLLESTEVANSESLCKQRPQHHGLLGQSYGQNKINTWMPQSC